MKPPSPSFSFAASLAPALIGTALAFASAAVWRAIAQSDWVALLVEMLR